MKTRHGVLIKYGQTEYKLSSKDLQLISDALEIVNPDSAGVEKRARALSAAFLALSEYAASVRRKR